MYLKFLMQCLNIVFHTLYELGLVLANGAADVRAHKQGVEPGEYAEHLVGVLGSSELITQMSGDASLDAI